MKVIDLSEPIFTGMEVYPGDPEVEVKQIHGIEREGWRLRTLFLGSHTGTHVDAFSHMDESGQALDEIPLERFFGKARVVVVEGEFPKKVGLVFASGKLSVDLFDSILAANPPFVVVSNNCEFEVELERRLLQNKIVTFSVANTDQLPKDKEFMFYGFPLKIEEGDGSPIRAVAIIE